MTSTNINTVSNASSSTAPTDTVKKSTSPFRALFGKKKSPSPPLAQKTAPRSSLDSEVTLLEDKKGSSPKSEVGITGRNSERSGSNSSSSSGGDGSSTDGVPSLKGSSLEAGWALLSRGAAAQDLSVPTYSSAYQHTSVLGRLAKGLTTPHSPYDYALPPSPPSSSSTSTSPLLQEDKKDFKAPRPPMVFH